MKRVALKLYPTSALARADRKTINHQNSYLTSASMRLTVAQTCHKLAINISHYGYWRKNTINQWKTKYDLGQ